MRFKRADMVGLAIAVGAPVGMTLLIVVAYGLQGHHGTPLIPFIATNLAVGAGLIGAFSRYIKNWGTVGSLLFLLGATITAVLVMQQTGNDATTLSTMLKLLGVGLFLLINLLIVWQILSNGVGPLLERRDARRAEPDANQA